MVLFLALVAVFRLYLAFTAYRVLALRLDLARGGSAKPIDWIAAVTCLPSECPPRRIQACGQPALVQRMGIVAIVFGFIGMQAAGRQMWMFVRSPTEKMFVQAVRCTSGNFMAVVYIAADGRRFRL